MLRVGESVGGYEIVAKLRAGGMATLFLGKKHGAAGFTRHVAIKVVHEHLASDPDFVRMFVDEALLQARIQNPHVVHVEELGEAQGAHFMVMEYVHGCALAQLLLALGKRKRRLQIDIVASIALQTLSGLHAAHELRGDDGRPLNVVHRDVSPQNVLLSRDGHVKLIDFGVAKAASSLNQTQGAMLKGKLRYMPPEQAFGRPVDRRADLYALGIVLWEMLTMRKLFAASDDIALLEMVRDPKVEAPSTWSPEVPPALDRVVLKALSKNPNDRYATAQEMRRALAEAVPSASMVEASAIAELLSAAVGLELEKERQALPAAVSAQVGPPIEMTRVMEERAEEVLLTMTLSAAGLEAKSGASPISGSMKDMARTGPAPVPPPGATPPPAPVSSTPANTPSQVSSAATPPAPTLIRPNDAPRTSIVPMLVAAVLVVAVGGGVGALFAIRSRNNTTEMIASPLPLSGRGGGSGSAGISVPTTPTAPASEPTGTATGTPSVPTPVSAAGIAPREATPPAAEATAEGTAEAPDGTTGVTLPGETAPDGTAPSETARPVVRRRRRERTEGTEGSGGAVPFSTEF